MTYKLTTEQRATCAAFEQVLRDIGKIGVRNASTSYNPQFGFSASVQDSHEAFCSPYNSGDKTIATALEGSIAQYLVANPPEKTPEQRKAERAAELREQLAKLEAESA